VKFTGAEYVFLACSAAAVTLWLFGVRVVRRGPHVPRVVLSRRYLGGYLSTLEGKIKMQKTFFYFVYDGRLYRKRKEAHSFESASIVCDLRICDITVCDDKRSNFKITSPAGYFFIFSAPDANDASRWALILTEQAKRSLHDHGIDTVPDQVKEVMHENPLCADCGHSSPDWVSLNLGILICAECAFIHHSLGAHISVPKCLVTSSECWTDSTFKILKDVGNNKANSIWEYLASPRTKPSATSPHEIKEQWIYAKYVCHHFIDRYLAHHSTDPSKYVFNAAVQGDNLDIIRGIASGGNARWRLSSDASSALHAAAQKGHAATCQLLIHLGADPSVVNELHETPLDVAAGEPTRVALRQMMQGNGNTRAGDGRGGGARVSKVSEAKHAT